jgi:hypothetical protein
VILGTGAGDVAFAWSSGDGLKWTDRSAPFEGRLPQGVASDASGFVAFGVGPSGPPWSARSSDGTSWEKPVPLPGWRRVRSSATRSCSMAEIAVFVGDPSGAIGVLRARRERRLEVGADERPDARHARPDRRRSATVSSRLAVTSRAPRRGPRRMASRGDRSSCPRGDRQWPRRSSERSRGPQRPGVSRRSDGPTDGGTSGGAVGALWSGPASRADALTEDQAAPSGVGDPRPPVKPRRPRASGSPSQSRSDTPGRVGSTIGRAPSEDGGRGAPRRVRRHPGAARRSRSSRPRRGGGSVAPCGRATAGSPRARSG